MGLAAWFAVAGFGVGISGCGYEALGGRAMGTTYSVQAGCPDALPRADIGAVLDRVDAQMSTYRGDSELMRFNRAPVGPWIAVSRDLAEVAAEAFRVAEQTGGAFDPTVGPLVARWGFGPEATVPFDERQIGYRNLRHRLDPPALAKRAPLALDLSAIAKGHAVDRIAELLLAARCDAFLIELGGEIRTKGRAPSGGAWRIGVESPAGDGYVGKPILLEDGALATSGDYRQYREEGGRRISHILDPRRGEPIAHATTAVTVVAQTARAADAYATALLVLGEEDGLDFATQEDLAALFVVRGESGLDTVQTPAMDAYRRR